jgi:predicted HAD superfamily Cof-like phosphohydrolase
VIDINGYWVDGKEYWEFPKELTKTNYEKVREFHRKFGAALDQSLSKSLRQTRLDLIDEEFYELAYELDPELKGNALSRSKLAKELADLLYVVYGTAAAFGIDIDKVFDKVHQNNLTKLHPDGTVKYRQDGKVLKPEGYKPVDLDTLLD